MPRSRLGPPPLRPIRAVARLDRVEVAGRGVHACPSACRLDSRCSTPATWKYTIDPAAQALEPPRAAASDPDPAPLDPARRGHRSGLGVPTRSAFHRRVPMEGRRRVGGRSRPAAHDPGSRFVRRRAGSEPLWSPSGDGNNSPGAGFRRLQGTARPAHRGAGRRTCTASRRRSRPQASLRRSPGAAPREPRLRTPSRVDAGPRAADPRLIDARRWPRCPASFQTSKACRSAPTAGQRLGDGLNGQLAVFQVQVRRRTSARRPRPPSPGRTLASSFQRGHADLVAGGPDRLRVRREVMRHARHSPTEDDPIESAPGGSPITLPAAMAGGSAQQTVAVTRTRSHQYRPALLRPSRRPGQRGCRVPGPWKKAVRLASRGEVRLSPSSTS